MDREDKKYKPTQVTGKIFLAKSGKSLKVCLVSSDGSVSSNVGFATIKSIENLLARKSRVALVLTFIDAGVNPPSSLVMLPFGGVDNA